MATRLLLLQARHPEDPMTSHEADCVQRRSAGRAIDWKLRNIFRAPLTTDILDGVDGLIVGGSGHFSVYDPRSRPWLQPLEAVLEEALNRSLPGFGICFGHQVLGRLLGADVVLDPSGAEVGTVELSLTEEGHQDPVFAELGERFWAQTGHTDTVVGRLQQIDVLAVGDVVDNQAFKVRGKPFYSTQFHPDLTGAEAQARYLAYQEKLDKAEVAGESAGAERFVRGRDEATSLLGRFIDRVVMTP